ncbi:DUF4913 domain-containing protein [Arthrobacter sp. N1]|uniref:DUF4913 domain-containing protein n=1 Tax=Arthrobacter sp. N1 TaxID=619291 RepID=UPI003BB0D931
MNRLNALWRAWEALRTDETTGLANWWNSYADPSRAFLFYGTEPFQGCTPLEHKPADKPLPLVPAPDGLYSGL